MNRVQDTHPAVVIGAGPYGLAMTAHLRARHIPTLTFGKPMDFWKKMPPEMFLKSSWSALNIAEPSGRYSLNRFAQATGIQKQEPVPLKVFLKYAAWFQERLIPDIDQTFVKRLTHSGKTFRLALADGREVQASRVVVATGVAPFAIFPAYTRHLPAECVSHSQDHSDFREFRGKRVVVVGSGQSALESAALLHEAGAETELIARGPINWIDRRLYMLPGFAKRIFYPPSDVGPPGVNWLVAFPQVFRRFPATTRFKLDERAVRPSGARWLRSRVDGVINMTPFTTITRAVLQGAEILLELSDGTIRQVDHILLGTGYQPDLDALDFIDTGLRKRIRDHSGSPDLNQWFESSVSHLYFTGGLAGYNFGPLCRFVVGSKATAHQIARHAAQGL